MTNYNKIKQQWVIHRLPLDIFIQRNIMNIEIHRNTLNIVESNNLA